MPVNRCIRLAAGIGMQVALVPLTFPFMNAGERNRGVKKVARVAFCGSNAVAWVVGLWE